MAKVGIIMGSKSDLPIMQEAIDILNEFGIENQLEFEAISSQFQPTIIKLKNSIKTLASWL